MNMMRLSSTLLCLAVLAGSLTNARSAQPEPESVTQAPGAGPWGVSSSAGSSRTHAEWFPKLAAAGVDRVRLFPEWREIQPTPSAWQWERADALVNSAASNRIEINAILMGSFPESQKAHAFPMSNLGEWSNYVAAVVGRYGERIRYWEVWNEGNGGFNDDHHTTADYARLAAVTHAAAKQASPRAQVGLSVASFDAPYLLQAMQAMADAGTPNRFDFLCVHPYEVADGLADPDGEIPFLWMSRLLRDALKARAPERADAEIWITEVSRRIEKRDGVSVTEADAAKSLIKLYTLALAQGIRCTQWFEAQDPVNEDSGFGLLDREGRERAAYRALAALAKHLGAVPKAIGWLALGHEQKAYGFVFQGGATPALIAWLPLGRAAEPLVFSGDVSVIDPLTPGLSPLKANQPLSLTDSPILVLGVPDDLVAAARANQGKPYPWGGDYSAAQSVSLQLGDPQGGQGIFQTCGRATPTVRFPDGSTGILVRGDQSVAFYVHPSFANLLTREYYVRVSVRRVAPGNVGMNLVYEAADSQGKTPYKNRGIWFGATQDTAWQAYTWHLSDASFSKMWGYDFSVNPEQSVPFVVGKIEVSTAPFK